MVARNKCIRSNLACLHSNSSQDPSKSYELSLQLHSWTRRLLLYHFGESIETLANKAIGTKLGPPCRTITPVEEWTLKTRHSLQYLNYQIQLSCTLSLVLLPVTLLSKTGWR